MLLSFTFLVSSPLLPQCFRNLKKGGGGAASRIYAGGAACSFLPAQSVPVFPEV